jgi:hypothetical protein
MTLSNSFQNFGFVWVNTVVTYALNFYSIEVLFLFGTLYSCMFYIRMKESMIKLDKTPVERF